MTNEKFQEIVLNELCEIKSEISGLKEGQTRLEVGQEKLKEGQTKLEQGQVKIEKKLDVVYEQTVTLIEYYTGINNNWIIYITILNLFIKY